MKKASNLRSAWWAILLAGFFLISLSFAFRFVREELDRVNRLAAARQELMNLQVESRDRLDQLAVQIDGQVVDPQVLFSDGAGKGLLFFSEIETTDLPEGYRHHRFTLRLEDLPAEDLSSIITLAENASPGWRVTSIRLASSSGSLQGELVLEALDKSPPEL